MRALRLPAAAPAAIAIVLALAAPVPGAAAPRAMAGSSASALPPDQLEAAPACDPRTATTVRGEELLQPGVLTPARPGRAAFDVGVVPTAGGAFLAPGATLSLANERGTVALRLRAGSCAAPGLTTGEHDVAGIGTWEVAAASDALEGTTGSGSFALTAGTERGAANAWSLELDGPLQAPQPSFAVSLVRSTWAHLGAGYAGRTATITVAVTNVGPGRAYDVRLAQVTPRSPNLAVVDHPPAAPVALRPGESFRRTVRVKVSKTADKGPLLFGQTLPLSFAVSAIDALDVPVPSVTDLDVTAPRFPPAL